MLMLMHGQVRQTTTGSQEHAGTGGSVNGRGRNHGQMRKRWRGNIHGVLRWPKARHRPARIFRRRSSSSTLHRPPSITMQPPGAAVASPRTQTSIASQAEAEDFCLRDKEIAPAGSCRKSLDFCTAWSVVGFDRGCVGVIWGREEVVGCVWAKRSSEEMEERGSVRPLERRQGRQQRLPMPRTAAIFIMISRTCESPPPLEEEWRLDHTNL